MRNWDVILNDAIKRGLSVDTIAHLYGCRKEAVVSAISSREAWAGGIVGYQSDVPTTEIAMPLTAPSGAYDAYDLARFLREAAERKMTTFQIAALLKVAPHRVAFVNNGGLGCMLRRQQEQFYG